MGKRQLAWCRNNRCRITWTINVKMATKDLSGGMIQNTEYSNETVEDETLVLA